MNSLTQNSVCRVGLVTSAKAMLCLLSLFVVGCDYLPVPGSSPDLDFDMKQAGSVMEVARVLIPSLRNRLYLNAPEWAEPKNPWHEKTIIVPMLKSVGDKLWTTATVIILERESRDHKSLGSFYVKVVAYFPGRSDSGFSLNVPTEKNGQKLVLIRRETDIFETEVVQMNWRQIVLLLKAVERECQ